MRQSSFDPCLLFWQDENGQLAGVCGVTVDDNVAGGRRSFSRCSRS